jgi:hypothetical protein
MVALVTMGPEELTQEWTIVFKVVVVRSTISLFFIFFFVFVGVFCILAKKEGMVRDWE